MICISNVISNLTQKIHSRQETNSSNENIAHQKKIAPRKKRPFTPEKIRFPIPELEAVSDPEKAIRDLTKTQREVFNYLIWMRLRFRAIGCSQSHIAQKLGVSRQTVNECLKTLHDLKFIFKGYRHRRTCFYNISEFFMTPAMKSKLKHLLPSFRDLLTFGLALLMSSMSSFSNNPTPSKVRIIRNYISSRIYHQTGKNMEIMQQGQIGKQNPISSAILGVTKRLALTRWGQIQLSKFPDEVIEYAAHKLSYVTEKRMLKDEFLWFCKVCSERCLEESINPDYGLMYQLQDIFKMPVNAQFVKEPSEQKPFDLEKYKKETKKNEGTLRYGNAQHTYSNKSPQKVQQEVSAQQLYPEYKPEPVKVESIETKKQNTMEWLKTPEAESFAKLMGKEYFEKFVANCLLGAP